MSASDLQDMAQGPSHGSCYPPGPVDERTSASAEPFDTEHPALSRRRELGATSARSLLLTVLGEFVLPRPEPVWTQTLIDVLAELGVEQKSARQALARTAAEGLLASDRVRPSGALVALHLRTQAAHRRRRAHLRLRHPHHGVGRAVARAAGERARVAATAAPPAAHPAGLGGARLTDAGRVGHAGPGEAGRGRAGDRGSRARPRSTSSFVGPFGGIGAERDVVAQAWDLAGIEARLRGLPRHVRVGGARHAVRGA